MPAKKSKTATSPASSKRRPAQRVRAGEAPKSDAEVGALVGQAAELLMRHGVKACLRAKLPSTVIFMAVTEQVGHLGSMMGLPYAQTLQAACNGVESVYRAVDPEQARGPRAVTDAAKAMIQQDGGEKTHQK